jgi:PAS domain S-box-containing protein
MLTTSSLAMKLVIKQRLKLKKISNLLLLGILLMIPYSHFLAQTPANSQKLVFLGNKNIAPVIYLEDSIPSGVAIDIVRALAKHLAQPIEIKAMDWQKAQTLVANGDADVLIQINQTEERKKIYDFSEPLLESQFSIFTLKERLDISGISSLRGLRVGVEKGGLPMQVLEKDPNISLVIIPNFIEGFKMLNEGGVDAIVVDQRVGAYILAKHKIKNIKASGEPIAFLYSSLAVKKGNTKLLTEINKAMQKIKADGTYQGIIKKWKPKEAFFYTREQITKLVYRLIILALFILFLITSVWMITLKKQLTGRKTAERKLKEEYFILNSIINSANAIVFSVDQQYRYTSFNLNHAVFMNTLYGAEIKRGFSMLDYITSPETREATKQKLDRVLAGDLVIEESSFYNEPPQYFQVSHSPITNEQEIIGVAVLAQDMTNRKHIEEEIKSLNEDLEKRVKERTSQLEAANKELESFAYSVSHDLRAPLRGIDGFSQVLIEEYYDKIDAQGRDYLQRVRAAAQRIGQLIDDILSLSKVNKSEIAMKQLNLSEIAQKIADNLQESKPKRNVGFIIQNEIKVNGDDRLLRIALENLMGNAWKFTSKHTKATIEFGMQQQNGQCAYYVRDDGAGFDMNYAQKLFGAFQRLHAADEFPGTGIGLATVQRIIHRHGGKVWAEGEVEKGATVYFTLP